MTPENSDTSHDTGSIEAAADAFAQILEPTRPTKAAQPAPEKQDDEAETEEVEATADTEGETSADDADTEDEGLEPDAEDEGDESEPDEEAEDDEEAEEAPPLDPKSKVTVTVDGKSEEITVEEAIKGYQRQSDYSRKTAELAEVRKGTEAELSQVRQERAQYAQLLTSLDAQLKQSDAFSNVDWETLRREDPVEFAAKRIEFQDFQERRQAIAAEQARLNEVANLERQKAMQELVKAEREALVKAVPAWQDEKIWARDKAAIREYGLKVGFSAEDLDSASDHRAIVALHKAMRYDRLVSKQKQGKPAATQAPAPLKPGTSNKPSRQVTERTEAAKRLRNSGSLQDAAEVFRTLL